MKPLPSLVLFALAATAALPLHATIDRVVEKSFTVTAAGTLNLETSGGSITVVSGPDGVVKITAQERIRASSEADADAVLKDLDLRFEQTGNDVRAFAKYTGSGAGFFFHSTPVQVSFVATVPAAFAADLHTSGGGVTVGDLAGMVKVRTSGGGIKLGKLGGTVDAHTSGGGITLAEARGEARLNTSGGSVKVGHVAGPVDVSTSGGGIHLEEVEQQVRAHTSGGSIHARLVGPIKGDCTLSTSGGIIDVTVDKSSRFHLDAETSGGGVRAEGLTITIQGGSNGRNKLVGDVNGGGSLLKLRTSGGGIQIESR